jgi:hypothetical protein
VCDECEPAEAAGDLDELSHRKVVSLCERDKTLAPTLTCVGFGDFRQRTVEIKVRDVATQRNGQRRKPAVRMNEAVEKRLFLSGVVERIPDYHQRAWQNLQQIRRSAESLHARFHVGIKLPAFSKRARAAENDLCGFGCELTTCVGSSGLNDDRPALDRPRDIERAADLEKLAFVVERMYARSGLK